jgi:hypothetical protein
MSEIVVETVNGRYAAILVSTGGVCEYRRAGNIVHKEYPSEQAWRATICDFSLRTACRYLDDISHGEPSDDNDVDTATAALNMLLTVTHELLQKHIQETIAIWRCMNRAVLEWSSIPTITIKMVTILERCEEVLDQVYNQTVQELQGHIETHNDGTWKPVAMELMEFVQQPYFHKCTESLLERIHIRAAVRRWLTWVGEDEVFLETCRAFLASFTISLG